MKKVVKKVVKKPIKKVVKKPIKKVAPKKAVRGKVDVRKRGKPTIKGGKSLGQIGGFGLDAVKGYGGGNGEGLLSTGLIGIGIWGLILLRCARNPWFLFRPPRASIACPYRPPTHPHGSCLLVQLSSSTALSAMLSK